MYAAVASVFDVCCMAQSGEYPVEAYTVAECCYSAVRVSTQDTPAAYFQSGIYPPDIFSIHLHIILYTSF